MMKKLVWLFTLLAPCVSPAQQVDNLNYFAADRMIIRNGVQAVPMCNGLFTSGRTLEQGFDRWDLAREVLKAIKPASSKIQ